jgi:hypothetical protein
VPDCCVEEKIKTGEHFRHLRNSQAESPASSRIFAKLNLACSTEPNSSSVAGQAYSNSGRCSGFTRRRTDRACPGVLSMRPLRSRVLIIS